MKLHFWLRAAYLVQVRIGSKTIFKLCNHKDIKPHVVDPVLLSNIHYTRSHKTAQ